MLFDEFRQLIRNQFGRETLSSSAMHFGCFQKLDCEDAGKYLDANRPKTGYALLDTLLPGYEDAVSVLARAARWCRNEHIDVQKSIIGCCVPVDGAERLSRFLKDAIPLRQAYSAMCDSSGKEDDIAEYSRFVTFARKHSQSIVRTLYHPTCTEPLFWIGTREDLDRVMSDWAILNGSNDAPEGFLSIAEVSKLAGIKPVRLLEWMRAHPDRNTIDKYSAFIPKDTADRIIDGWTNVRLLSKLAQTLAADYPAAIRSRLIDSLIDAMTASGYLLLDFEYPQMQSGAKYYDLSAESKLISAAREILDDTPSIRVSADMQTISLINEGVIPGIKTGNSYYYSKSADKKVRSVLTEYASLDVAVALSVNKTESLFNVKDSNNRFALIEYLKCNSWWNIPYFTEIEPPVIKSAFGLFIHRSDIDALCRHMSVWFEGFGKNHAEKLALLIKANERSFPVMCGKLRTHYFPNDRECEIAKADVDMADYLFSLLERDISDMTDDEIMDKVVKPFKQSSVISGKKLSEFLNALESFNYEGIELPNTGYKRENQAYSIRDMSIIVAHVVDDDTIAGKDLIRKAVDNPDYASLWLYISLHCFSIWRSTDYVRIPPLELQDDPEYILAGIADGSYPLEKRTALARVLIMSVADYTPHKTNNRQHVPHLFFSCPESCLEPFGTILAIAAAHHAISGNWGHFVSFDANTSSNILGFFGLDVLDACGGKPFSGQRANKTLLQSVEVVARDDLKLESRVAYHIASIMRSHKGSLEELSQTTEIYLRDSEFYGLSPEYVLFQMAERGVCSFITDILLKQCYGEMYTELRLEDKTSIIKELGLIPYGMNQLRELSQKALAEAEDLVAALAADSCDYEQAVLRLAIGNASCKSGYEYCLCSALGVPCQEPKRANGIGCRYEILTKASLVQYLAEYNRLSEASESAFENQKNEYLRDNLVAPKIFEIMSMMAKTSSEELESYKRLGRELISSNDR